MKPMGIHDGTNMINIKKEKISVGRLLTGTGVGKKICHGILRNRNVLRCKKLGKINVIKMGVNLMRATKIVGIEQTVPTLYHASQLNRALVQPVWGRLYW